MTEVLLPSHRISKRAIQRKLLTPCLLLQVCQKLPFDMVSLISQFDGRLQIQDGNLIDPIGFIENIEGRFKILKSIPIPTYMKEMKSCYMHPYAYVNLKGVERENKNRKIKTSYKLICKFDCTHGSYVFDHERDKCYYMIRDDYVNYRHFRDATVKTILLSNGEREVATESLLELDAIYRTRTF